MTIEGAPHLKAEHYPVFDCANKCGKTRQAVPVGRVAHPHDGGRPAVHLAGRSPRRSTCRTTATVEDVKKAYLLSWQLMIKANALYRDGSKLSQPLNTVADAPDVEAERPRSRRRAEAEPVQDRREDRPPLHRPAAAGCPTAGPATRRRPASATTRSTCAPASTRTARSARSSSTCTRKGPPSAA